jgi:hypothetical protein
MSTAAKLPVALQQWQAWLAWFHPEIVVVLGEMFLKLNPLLGPSAYSSRGNVEPDGIEDLRRRGTYDRLLLSEWALADALPDEFLRRAATSEHLFLAPKLITHQADGQISAVFDTGPAQWGAPRLVHVAMWILLARRAQLARARFVWGIADEPGVLHDADSPAMLLNMLRARTTAVCSGPHLRKWQEHLSTSGSPTNERWLLSADDDDSGIFSHRVSVKRGFDDGLHLSIGTRQGARRVQLPLPSPGHAASLLRGDFLGKVLTAKHRKTSGKFSLRQPPLLSVSGEYVAQPLLGENRVLIARIQSEGEKPASPRYRQWAAGMDLFAATLAEKSFGGVAVDAQQMSFWNMSGFRAVHRPGPDEFTAAPGLTRWLSCVWLNSGGKNHRVLLLDGAGRLLTWTNAASRESPLRTHDLLDHDVLTLVQGDAEYALYAKYESGYLSIKTLHRGGDATVAAKLPIPEKPITVFFQGKVAKGKWKGALCVEQRPGRRGGDRPNACRLYQMQSGGGFDEQELVVAPGYKLIGLIADAQAPEGLMLLALRADRRALVAMGSGGSEIIYQSICDMMSVSVSIDGDKVALVSLDGQLVVLSGGGRRWLTTLSGTGGAGNE